MICSPWFHMETGYKQQGVGVFEYFQKYLKCYPTANYRNSFPPNGIIMWRLCTSIDCLLLKTLLFVASVPLYLVARHFNSSDYVLSQPMFFVDF